MKIAFINSFYAPDEVGGAEKSVRFLAETLVQKGHEATVICLGRARESSELNGVRIERLPHANLYFPTDAGSKGRWQKMLWHGIDSYNPLASRQVGMLLRKLRPDVVHTNNLGGFSVAAWSASHAQGLPVVHTLRDYYLMCPNTAMFKNGAPCPQQCTSCRVMSKPRLAGSQHIQRVVGNSQFILNKHLEFGYFKHAQTDVIYNAYQPQRVENRRDPTRTTFGFIGRLAPSKGIEVLIEAVKGIDASYPHQVLIAGDGDAAYVDHLKALASGLPVTFMGRMQPHDLYDQVDWTIVPSVWDEPLARVLFESFAHGVPVIGSNTGGTPEILTDGQTGLLYTQPMSAQALRVQMLKALSDSNLATNLSSKCSTYSENFRPQNVYLRYEQAYLKSLNGH